MKTWKLTAYGENFYRADEIELSQEQLGIILDWQIHRTNRDKVETKLRKAGLSWGMINDLITTTFEHPDIIEVDVV